MRGPGRASPPAGRPAADPDFDSFKLMAQYLRFCTILRAGRPTADPDFDSFKLMAQYLRFHTILRAGRPAADPAAARLRGGRRLELRPHRRPARPHGAPKRRGAQARAVPVRGRVMMKVRGRVMMKVRGRVMMKVRGRV